jgi:ribonuclease J
MKQTNELVFVALGGLGEIGMNCALYGFGPEKKRKWLMVDCGISFAGDELPGIDLVMPDVSFIKDKLKDLVALVITHAHEDHIGAVARLWPELKCPVYASEFAVALLKTRGLADERAPKVPLHIFQAGQVLDLAPFQVEPINMAHSIPESHGLAITTPVGTVVHTGDWKIDYTPLLGNPTNSERLKELGDAGVLALVCDSTNVLRDGISPSEQDVAATLQTLMEDAKGRVAVTTFASNVARIRAMAQAAVAAGREVVVVGRAMDNVVEIAREQGMLDGLPEFKPASALRSLPREKVAIVLTGSQGESRAALARAADNEHPDVRFDAGDRVIMSSRAIPGNEKGINRIINGLIAQGVDVITDRTHLVHVSGHPRRDELKMMYDWVRPQIAVPVHGEALHLHEHRLFAKAQGVPHVMKATDGTLLRLAPDAPEVLDTLAVGRMYTDGRVLIPHTDASISERRKLAFAGVISIAVALDDKGHLAGDPQIMVAGLPSRIRDGREFEDVIIDGLERLLEGLPKPKRRNSQAVEEAVYKGIRSLVSLEWDKKPTVHVHVIDV